METKKYNIGTQVIMKKQHPCGTNLWEITRLGADIQIMIPRIEFNKKLKKIVKE